MKQIILKRGEDYITIGFDFPFFLKEVNGLHKVEYENTTENNYGLDGTTVKTTKQKERYIDITFDIRKDYSENRNRIYNLLPNGVDGELIFYDEDDNVKTIGFKVENIDIPSMGVVRSSTISLLCENPFFRDTEPTYYNMAQWVGGFEFDIDLTDANELDTRQAEQIKVLSNPSNVNIPLKIVFKANGTVKNPQLENLTTGEWLTINDTITANDELVIYTERGRKQKIIKNGQAANNLWGFGSDWLNLPVGDSMFRYDAESGLDYLDVEIETVTLYRGA